MQKVVAKKGETVVIDVETQHFAEPYLDWEKTAIVIPAMGYIIQDGVLFIRGKDRTWIWMTCELVDSIVGDDNLPELRDALDAIWRETNDQ